MSTIDFSEQDYASIKNAADAAGMPVDAWVVANLPLKTRPSAPADGTGSKLGRTMADRFAGRLGVVSSGGDGRLSENTGEAFTDYLEEKRRAGTL